MTPAKNGETPDFLRDLFAGFDRPEPTDADRWAELAKQAGKLADDLKRHEEHKEPQP